MTSHPFFLDPEAAFHRALGFEVVKSRGSRAILLRKARWPFTRWIILCESINDASDWLPEAVGLADEWIVHSFHDDRVIKNKRFVRSLDGDRLFPLATQRLDLSLNREALFGNLSSTARNLVFRNERAGHDVRVIEALDDGVSNIVVQMVSTLRKMGLKPASAASIEMWIERRDAILFHLETTENQPSHTAVVFCRKPHALLVYQASTFRDASGGAHFLQWKCIEILKSMGMTSYDLGGINESLSGVKAFKSALGGESVSLGAEFICRGTFFAVAKRIAYFVKRDRP